MKNLWGKYTLKPEGIVKECLKMTESIWNDQESNIQLYI